MDRTPRLHVHEPIEQLAGTTLEENQHAYV
jgi:hypothetical protein